MQETSENIEPLFYSQLLKMLRTVQTPQKIQVIYLQHLREQNCFTLGAGICNLNVGHAEETCYMQQTCNILMQQSSACFSYHKIVLSDLKMKREFHAGRCTALVPFSPRKGIANNTRTELGLFEQNQPTEWWLTQELQETQTYKLPSFAPSQFSYSVFS